MIVTGLISKNMAGEEDDDVELRDLVAQTLESQGVLGSIRVRFLIKAHI